MGKREESASAELLRRLATAKVDFVVVGGLAVNAWGVVRGTRDVDVVVADDPANLSGWPRPRCRREGMCSEARPWFAPWMTSRR